MNETITYQCPNCGGGLVFDPEKQKYTCEYCLSEFGEEAFLKHGTAESGEQETDRTEGSGEAVLYTCPSCGAEIVTEETTAADFCYYCHNPVILSGRLLGEYHPDYVIPFSIEKEKAVEIFNTWIRKKRFIPKAFYSEEQIEKITGVYFPYLLYSCKADGKLDARADRLRVWVSGSLRYTEKKNYEVQREGVMDVRFVPRNALKKANRKLVEGVLPYEMNRLKPFAMGFLSGFQAERRDMEEASFDQEVKEEVKQFAVNTLKTSISSYDSVQVKNQSVSFIDERWEYALLPVWSLTYREEAKDEVYYFAVNGQTGKVCGQLPIDRKKLILLFAEIFFPVLLVMLIAGYFI